MNKKVIQGNTPEGKDYAFEIKHRGTRNLSNTDFYHIELTKTIKVKRGDRLVDKDRTIIKLYTPVDYQNRFIEQFVAVDGGEKRSLYNNQWLKSYYDRDGNIGVNILFNPTTYEPVPETDTQGVIVFETVRSYMGAKKELLIRYCTQEGISYKKEDDTEKSVDDLKELIKQHLEK